MGRLRTNSFLIHTGAEKKTSNCMRFNGTGLLINEDTPKVWAKDSNGNVRKDKSGNEIPGDPIQEILPAAWLKVVDGWAKDGNWGGYLQVTSKENEGGWIQIPDDYMRVGTKKANQFTFVDKDDYYEIWYDGSEGKRPLTIVDGNQLRFVDGAEPARFNIFDSTH
ncbi:hypothetical protein [Streptomyces sp. BF23-19]|uniref:hypothetical protein n=1 Tax=unclassified Streptomyces TaxID=2593676 RepID=UPI0034E378A1